MICERDVKRRDLAEQICAFSSERLLQYGVTRIADVTGLDTIGLPIFTACRPPGEAITISAGKGLTRIDSMAGAILEGVELWSAEHPELSPEWFYCSHAQAVKQFKSVVPFEMLQLARDAPVTVNTPLPFEEMDDVLRGGGVMVPSDMIWLISRCKPPFQYFQSSSSGLAAGVSYKDAMLSGLYEVVERDGWAISEFIQEHTGQWRECISLEGELHSSIQFCMDRLYASSVTPFLFDLTRDTGVPIFRCTILDSSNNSPGAFSGFGCSLDPVTAARRAITEACQGRAAYIGGARDDLFRRRFILMKNLRMDILLDMYESLPLRRNMSDYIEVHFDSIDEELSELVAKLKHAGITEVYCKTLYTCHDPDFTIVKVICPQLETPLWEHYASGKRAVQALLEVR